MIKRVSLSILIICIAVFILLATLYGYKGLAGELGRVVGEKNIDFFGLIAFVWPCILVFCSIFWLIKKKLSLRFYLRVFSFLILSLVFLALQYLWFGIGLIAEFLLRDLEALVGYAGIYILLLLFLCGAWMLFSISHFFKSMRRIFVFFLTWIKKFFLWILHRGIEFLDFLGSRIYRFYKEKRDLMRSKRAHREMEQYYEFEPEPPIPFTQVPDIKDSHVRVFYEPVNNFNGFSSEVSVVESSKKDGEIKDYSQQVLIRNKKFFANLAEVWNSPQNLAESDQDRESQSLILSQERDLKRDQGLENLHYQDLDAYDKEGLQIHKNKIQEDKPKKDRICSSAKDTQVENDLGKNEYELARNTSTYFDLDLASGMDKQALLKFKVVNEIAENKKHLESLEKGEILEPEDYKLPSIELLSKALDTPLNVDEDELDGKIQNLLSKLRMFKIEGDVVATYSGPLVSTFEFRPADHIKVRSILALSDDLAMAMEAQSIRIQAPIPGKNVVGIEVPNRQIQTIYIREILESEIFLNSASPLTLALGKDIVGKPFITDLRILPHLLIAGTTGSGKSVGMNAMIVSLLYRNSPENLRFVMIDPKMVEFSLYEDIPHLLTPIITNPKNAITALVCAVREMERRYKLMSALKVKTIESYNQKCQALQEKILPYLVIIIDELADLMMTGGREAEFPIIRIAQMGRACGIHLIVATQRPSSDVVTGIIKTNLPSRISFKVSNKIDSRVVIDVDGAQSLLGRGDMIFTPPSVGGVIRLHAPWISEHEIEDVVKFIKSQRECNYDNNFLVEEKHELSDEREGNTDHHDELTRAKEIILRDKKTSIAYLQRRMHIGFNRAANIIEELEKEGFLSPPNKAGSREILGLN